VTLVRDDKPEPEPTNVSPRKLRTTSCAGVTLVRHDTADVTNELVSAFARALANLWQRAG